MKRINLVLLGILLLALILRIVQINNIPLYGDELTGVYDAYSILKTGHDQLGHFLPLTFTLGDSRPAGYIYGSIPLVAIFGPTVWGIRLLSILSGLGIVLVLFYLGKKLISQPVGLAAAFLTAISPWDLSLSRGGFEAHFAIFLNLLGLATFLAASRKKWLYVISGICFGLAIHTYSTNKLIVPILLLILLGFTGWLKKPSKEKISQLAFFVIPLSFFIALLIQQALTSGSEARFQSNNLLAQQDVQKILTQGINQDRYLDNLPSLVSPLFHNKPLENMLLLGDSYLKNFTLDFLFLHGDENPRHNMATMGELYIIEMLTVAAGAITLWKRQRKLAIFLGLWILIAPLATTLLLKPHAIRSAMMLPPILLLSAAGLVTLWSARSRYLKVILIAGFLIQFTILVERLYLLSPNKFDRFWAGPAKQASQLAIAEKHRYDFVILSDKIDAIEFAYPVYDKLDPKQVIQQNNSPKTNLGEFQFKKFDNVYIGHVPESKLDDFVSNLGGSVFFIGSNFEEPFLKNYQIITGKDKKTALVTKIK